MRKIFISFIISLSFAGLFMYLFDNLSLIKDEGYEFVEEEYGVNTQTEFLELFQNLRDAGYIFNVIDKGNFTAMLIVVSLTIGTTFLTLHLFIDKMFFKEFYKGPDIKLGLRRTALFMMYSSGLLLMQVIAYFDVWSILFVTVLAIFFEVILSGQKLSTLNTKLNTNEKETESKKTT